MHYFILFYFDFCKRSNHEGLAGAVAAIDYLSELGRRVCPSVDNRRAALVAAMTACQQYEKELSAELMTGLLRISEVKVYGITDFARLNWRTPTFGIRLAGQTPDKIAKVLGDRNIYTWQGNFYAIGITEKLGVENKGGLLRIGLVHFNTVEEIYGLLETLEGLTTRVITINY